MVAAWWVSRLAGGEDVTLAEVESGVDERCAGTSISSVQVEAIDAAEAVDAERARPPGIVRAGLLWDWPALMSRYPQIAPWTIDRLTPAELDVLLLSRKVVIAWHARSV